MAIASTDMPTVVVQTGPMVVGHHKGEVLGAAQIADASGDSIALAGSAKPKSN